MHVSRDLEAPAYEPGAWLRGTIYPQRCDLSPDGRWFAYFALKASAVGARRHVHRDRDGCPGSRRSPGGGSAARGPAASSSSMTGRCSTSTSQTSATSARCANASGPAVARRLLRGRTPSRLVRDRRDSSASRGRRWDERRGDRIVMEKARRARAARTASPSGDVRGDPRAPWDLHGREVRAALEQPHAPPRGGAVGRLGRHREAARCDRRRTDADPRRRRRRRSLGGRTRGLPRRIRPRLPPRHRPGETEPRTPEEETGGAHEVHRHRA